MGIFKIRAKFIITIMVDIYEVHCLLIHLIPTKALHKIKLLQFLFKRQKWSHRNVKDPSEVYTATLCHH